jgi:hypothetical protein
MGALAVALNRGSFYEAVRRNVNARAVGADPVDPGGRIIQRMSRRGVFLVLVLAALMDVGSPLVPEPFEALERAEEAAHGRRRVPNPVRGAPPEPVAVRATAASLTVRRPPRDVPSARRNPEPAPLRKVPPALSDLASSPDAH